ncbi:DMT family transporter [Paraburkholderia sp. SARCC-3016]|uniref:DMT family transporter n=1 Tax=Paraburkholderia sp. SARCC-3016 TaxID=3058611 RepID=UPI0028097E61|nr:DMT family transporter [Paraburkholderia sp. SARCC-3016]MDQ7976186.1 DMT family transporter [Paraburkholderia sp. SARCC-3016]
MRSAPPPQPLAATRTAASRSRLAALTTLAMFAFAGNSLLCRVALKATAIDPATFTTIRIVAAAVVLWLIQRGRARPPAQAGGDWYAALALFVYAAAFSFAYVRLAAGTGALLLFGAVQATMIGYALWSGERLRIRQWLGFALALAGLVALVMPGLVLRGPALPKLAPPLASSLLMLGAGVAWGVYSLRGKRAADPVAATAGNFLRAVPFAVALSGLSLVGTPMHTHLSVDHAGVVYALISGAVTSGLGYVIWYAALKALKASSAATVQLSVPLIAALGGVAILNEALTARLVASAVAILGGIALVIVRKPKAG